MLEIRWNGQLIGAEKLRQVYSEVAHDYEILHALFGHTVESRHEIIGSDQIDDMDFSDDDDLSDDERAALNSDQPTPRIVAMDGDGNPAPDIALT